jgi:hypothetical protein
MTLHQVIQKRSPVETAKTKPVLPAMMRYQRAAPSTSVSSCGPQTVQPNGQSRWRIMINSSCRKCYRVLDVSPSEAQTDDAVATSATQCF